MTGRWGLAFNNLQWILKHPASTVMIFDFRSSEGVARNGIPQIGVNYNCRH